MNAKNLWGYGGVCYNDPDTEAALLREAKTLLNQAKYIFQDNPEKTRIKLPVGNRSDDFFKKITFLAMLDEYQLIVYRSWFGLRKSKLVFIKEECIPGRPYPYSIQYKGGLK